MEDKKYLMAKRGLQCIISGDIPCVKCPGDGQQGAFKCQKQACAYALEFLEENGWHSTRIERPILPENPLFASAVVICADIGIDKTYALAWERTIINNKTVYRWKYMRGKICKKPPDYWRYMPKPPSENIDWVVG